MTKGYKTGGRTKGTLNKETLRRRAMEELELARRGGKELPSDVLERLMKVAEGAAQFHKPPSQAEVDRAVADGRKPRSGDWDRFGEWFDRVAYCAKELARYREPQLRAVAMVPVLPRPEPKVIEADNVVDISDPEALVRVYQRRIAAVR